MITHSFPVDALLLLGPTGVGKSPLGDAIARKGLFSRRALHMDFGSELRAIAHGTVFSSLYSRTELDFIRGVLDQGLLLENEHFVLAQKIITLFLERNSYTTGDVLVLNGIPRHTGQARDISSLATIHALVVLDCTAESIYRRLVNNVGGDRTERIDDDKELVAKKLDIYTDRTAPLIKHYRDTGSLVYHITVNDISTTEDAYKQLLLLTAANPPVALVAEPPQ